MQRFPHTYAASAAGAAAGEIALNAATPVLPQLVTAPPRQFGGPGDRWSPEDLLMAALAGCFILTFRAVARASKLEWTHLECEVEGTLDRVESVTQFTRAVTRASLSVPPGTDTLLCERVLGKAERDCLIANSLRCSRELQMEIIKGSVVEEPSEELSCAP
jgi:organic hydroperoxide reductase OsmC/OhrA